MIYDCVGERVEYLSDNAERILGLPAEDYKHNMWIARSYLSDDDFMRICNSLALGEQKEIGAYDFVLRNPRTGEERELRSKIYPICDNGRVVKQVFVTSDMTAVKASQKMLESAVDTAQRANEAKRQFLSRMSHEIRTPLNTIIGLVEVMKNDSGDQRKNKEDLRKINIAAQHLLELINDLLDTSKIESGKMEFEQREFSLNVMLSEISMIMGPKAEEKRQVFDVMLRDVASDNFIGAELRIRQVLLNFLSNAVKFTPEGGKIKLVIRQMAQRGNAACLNFSVTDNGMGMEPEFTDRIFQPFEQADETISRKFGGSGLGMALSKSFVETMGGSIYVESVAGKGSKFSFDLWLPFADAPLKTPDRFRSLRVLLVDDEIEMREHLKLMCEQLGIETQSASSGAEAVHILKNSEEPFDIAFVDLYMPDVDGIRTAEWIRNEAGNKIMIVLVSAYDYKRVEQEARDAGVTSSVSYTHLVDGKETVVFAIMPCTAKKDEQVRPEFIHADGSRDTDGVITTQEFASILKQAGIVFEDIEPEAADMPFGITSGAGVIFGVTGGVAEAVIRRVVDDKSNNMLHNIAYTGVRGLDGTKEANIPFGEDKRIKIAVVNGLLNAERLIGKIKSGEASYDFVEVMACPGGCIAGAGQPFARQEGKQERSRGLYDADKLCQVKRSEENPVMMSLYSGILKNKVHELLHVNYTKGEGTKS